MGSTVKSDGSTTTTLSMFRTVATEICSIGRPGFFLRCAVSLMFPPVIIIPSGLPRPSQTRCSLVVSPTRDRPIA